MSNPCFVVRADWPCGHEARVFDAYYTDLRHDRRRTLHRFRALRLHRGRDRLGPVAVAPPIRVESVAGAVHAPFWSTPAAVAARLATAE